MNPQTLTLWENGAVTLPKEWREQYPTSLFLVEETIDGNLPLLRGKRWQLRRAFSDRHGGGGTPETDEESEK